MNQNILAEALADLPLGGIRYFDSIGSTNDEAVAWAGRGAPDYALVLADEQTRGRGRAGRKWFTHPGAALAFSLILHLSLDERRLLTSLTGRFTGLGALAVSQVLQNQYSLPAQIKWPNDVLVNQKKLCGVLVEAQWHGDQLSTVVLGIGLNVTPIAVPAENSLPFPASSLEGELGHAIDRLALLHDILAALVSWRPRLASENFLQAWEARLAYQGEWVRILSPGGSRGTETTLAVGHILGLASDCGLRFCTHAGEDVVFRGDEVLVCESADPVRNGKIHFPGDGIQLRPVDSSPK